MRAAKPNKPYPTFPLTAHPAGTWCKKIKGRLYHFGGWADPTAALAKYHHQVDDLQAGREPTETARGRLTMVDLCNEFLESKQVKVEIGKLSAAMHWDYVRSCKRLLGIVGRTTIVELLKPKDFDIFAGKLAKGVSVGTFANRVRLARVMFRWAATQELIPKPLNFGENFAIPDKATMRADRQSKPPREFKADELRAIIDAAGNPLKAMILLGLNSGFGQNDVATLPQSAIDIDGGWIDFPRPKTAVERRCPLWPETVAALRTALASRPEPSNADFAGLAFVTKYGNPYVRLSDKGTNHDAVAGAFAKILAELKLNGNRRAFYSLRRTFETIGGASRDQICVDHIMGHSPASDDMSAVYRQSIDDDRLRAVADHVRLWLWPDAKTTATPKLLAFVG